MTQNANISVSGFLQFCKKEQIRVMFFLRFMHFFQFCMYFIFVITFEPNKIQTRLETQNDRLNLSFVKDIHVTLLRSGSEWPFDQA